VKIESIKAHLQPYSIMKKSQTTINHAFASAIAPHDAYDIKTLKAAMAVLGQDAEIDLLCVYCDEPAETWDHVFGLVRNLKFSGYGHVVGNLLPCCKKCNSEKGNRDWEDFLKKKMPSNSAKKIENLKRYFEKYLPKKFDYEEIKTLCPDEINQLNVIKDRIKALFKEADVLAEAVREKIKKA